MHRSPCPCRAALLLPSLLALAFAPASRSAVPDTVAQVTAATSAAAPHVTLEWPLPPGSGTASARLWRRVKGAAAWETPILLPSQATGYADMEAQPGVAYEYSLEISKGSGLPAYGGIVAGHDLPLVEMRGKVLLYVDESQAAALGPELEQLQRDLTADGWRVRRHDGPREVYGAASKNTTHYAGRKAEREAMRAVIKSHYDAEPGDDWALFIIGRAPVAYSGNQAPDNHSDHVGAWPTDLYYGDMTGTWTDETVSNTSAADPRNHNTHTPGDGKFDQITTPAPVVLQVGRLDMAGMESVPAGFTETGLLRQYLARNHRFRHGLAPYDAVQRRALIGDGFSSQGTYTIGAWKSGISFFGRGAGRVDELDWFSTLQTQSFLFAYAGGGGTYTSAGGIGTSADFASKDSRAVFIVSYGSYFGDWDTPGNFLRAPLAGTPGSLGLTNFWSPSATLFHMAMGETVGYSARHVQNETTAPANGGWAGGNRSVTRNLMGDPTLRLHTVRPPRNVTARVVAGGVALAWQASPDATAGYHVYRSASPECDFIRLTGEPATAADPLGSPITDTSFIDESVTSENHYTYLVKAVRREVSASGSYSNQSIGIYADLDYLDDGEAAPSAPSELTATTTGAQTVTLSWQDNADNETGYRLERFDPAAGAWSLLALLPANTTSHVDTGAPVGQPAHYRVQATGTGGASAWSNSAADYTLPGVAQAPRHVVASRADEIIRVPLERRHGSRGEVGISWQTADFTALAPTDYTARARLHLWSHGETAARESDIPLTNDGAPQLTRFFRVNYTNPSNGLTLGDTSFTWVQVMDPASQTLPGWTTQIITPASEPSPWSGYAEYHDGAFGLTARTGSVATGRTVDSLRFVHLPVTGDFQMTARAAWLATDLHPTQRAGLMLRASLDANAIVKGIYLYGASTVIEARRATAGAQLATTKTSDQPQARWLRLRRDGNTVRSWYSADGASWTETGPTATLSLPATVHVGMFVASETLVEGLPAYARFDQMTIEATLTTPANFQAVTGPGVGEVSLSWATVPGAISYEVQRSESAVSDFSTIATLSASSGGLVDAGLITGASLYYRVRAIDPGGASEWSPVLSSAAYLPSTFAGWAYLHFGADATEETAGRLADPDGDGLPNLLEYALGSFPLVTDAGIFTPRATIRELGGTEYLTMSFVRDPFVHGVKLYLEASGDLRSPEWERIDPLDPANQVSVENDAPEPGLQRIVAKDTQPLAASPSRFLRLRAVEGDYPLFATGFETGSGYRAGESVAGFHDPALPGTAAWTMWNSASPALPLASTANPLSGSQALRIIKTNDTSSGGVTLNLASLELGGAPFILRFGLAIHNYSAGTGNQLQVYLGNTGTDPGGGKYWTLLIFNEGVFYLYRASATGASNQAVNLGAYTNYADYGDYVSVELGIDPITKTYTGVRLSGAKGTGDFTTTLAGATLPWRPDQAGDPASVFQFVIGSNDLITVDLDELSLNPDAADGGESFATVATAPQGFQQTPLPPGTSSLGLPLLNDAVLSARIESVSGHTLTLANVSPLDIGALLAADPDTPAYIEVSSGALEGERLDIDVRATITAANQTVVLASDHTRNTLPADRFAELADNAFTLRRHVTLTQLQTLFSPALTGSNDASRADSVYLFENGSFVQYHLRADGSTWRSLSLIDWRHLPMPPGEGLLVRLAQPGFATAFGVVRPHAFRQNLAVGLQFTAPPFPVPASPGDLGAFVDPALPEAVRWFGSNSPAAADSLFLFSGGSFVQYYLRADGAWRRINGFTDYADEPFLPPDQSRLIRRFNPDTGWSLPSPVVASEPTP